MSKYILKELRWEKSIVLSVKSIKNLKSLKYHNICDKTLLLSSISNKCKNEDDWNTIEESIEILKILGLIENR